MSEERYDNKNNNPSRLELVPACTRFDGRLLCDKQKPVPPPRSLSILHLSPLCKISPTLSYHLASCQPTHHSVFVIHISSSLHVFKSRCTNVAPVTSSSATSRTATLTWTNMTIGWNVKPALDNFGLNIAASST